MPRKKEVPATDAPEATEEVTTGETATAVTTPSFMDIAITNACNGKSSFAKATALVEAENAPHFANRIGGAWAKLVTSRNQLRILDKEDNGTRAKDIPIKPEMFLSICQYLLNQACWAARRYLRAQQENADQEKVNGVTGIDFSQDVAQEDCIEPMSTQEIEESLATDFLAMLRLHSFMASKMNYLPEIEDLYLYAEREQEGEVWKITGSAMAFDEALDLMDEVLAKMNERQDAELVQDMDKMDFSGDEPLVKDAA
jgi:hypothetical protein